MIPKLAERLVHLENARAAAAPIPLPPELVEANLYAVAIALGDYPHRPEPAPSHRQDSISDGFARGIGYLDCADMDGACRKRSTTEKIISEQHGTPPAPALRGGR